MLVVEDEAIISLLIEDMLLELGAGGVRIAASLRAALSALDEALPDLAVLDVNVGGERIYPVAERLEAAGIGFVFATGYGRSGLEPRWAEKTVVQKPFDSGVLRAALAVALAGARR
ncbi:MAG TPA: response regulator [Rhizomicrobium sp.]